jgi:hypothetical protein
VEHVERQDEREDELRGDADELEKRGDELEQRAEELDGQIEDVREEFERKKQSSEVPGAQEQDFDATGSPSGDAGGAPQEDE